jgi:hypothetical protein
VNNIKGLAKMDGGASLRHPFLPSSPRPSGEGQRTAENIITLHAPPGDICVVIHGLYSYGFYFDLKIREEFAF